MKNKKRLLKRLILTITLLLTVAALAACGTGATVDVVFHNGLYGVVSNKEINNLSINEKKIELYKTTKDRVTLNYESMNLDNNYDNKIIINNFEYQLTSSNDTQNEFINNQLSFLGLIIDKEELVITISSGTNEFNSYDNFTLRNLFLRIGSTEIWPKEYPKHDYQNEPFKFGSSELGSPYRTNYQNEMTFRYEIPAKILNHYGKILEFEDKDLKVEINNKETLLQNPSFVDVTTNLQSGTIDEQLDIKVISNELDTYQVLMNDVKVANDLVMKKEVWSPGNHNLKVIATNENGFTKVLEYNVTLPDSTKDLTDISFDLYETGMNEEKPTDLSEIGHLVEFGEEVRSPFSKYAIQNFKVKEENVKTIIWKGSAPINRTITLEVYNHTLKEYEVVSVNRVLEDSQIIKLGFDYEGKPSWIKDGYLNVRVVSTNLVTKLNYDGYLYHLSDTQYIVQKANGNPGVIKDRAVTALNEMRDEVLRAYRESNLIYTMFTGDMIQSIMHEGEWDTFMTHFMDGIVSEERPLGILSGNHDIGATGDYGGLDGLDDDLSYDSYYEHLGENYFNEFSWYGGSYLNNRSHFDKIMINGEELIFLYLGWGSSRVGIHVSDQDIAYAKDVLTNNPNHRVVLLVHDYLNNRGSRTATGNVLFEQLVKPYPNICMVLAGHINGTTYRVDHLDDNLDGITDRRVIQSLTNFQEEENTNGASFIRKLGLDFTNNKIGFELYSPYYKDTDIFVTYHPGIVKKDRNFQYDFDFNLLRYGLITYELGR